MAEDLFDPLLTVEDQLYQDGYKDGLADGIQAGKLEGRSFGMAKGFEKFAEAGRLYSKSVVWANQLPGPALGAALDKAAHGQAREKEGEGKECTLQRLPNNVRLARNVVAVHALMEPETLATENSDEAVQDVDERIRRAQGKVKVVERIIGGRQAREEKGTTPD